MDENLANNLLFFWYEPGIIRVPVETHSLSRVGLPWIKNFSLERFSITANTYLFTMKKLLLVYLVNKQL